MISNAEAFETKYHYAQEHLLLFMSNFTTMNEKVVMDERLATSSSIDSHDPDQILTYTVLKDSTGACTEENASVIETR